MSGSLSHKMKVWENSKSTILSWSVIIPHAIIGDPSAVLKCINVTCVASSKKHLLDVQQAHPTSTPKTKMAEQREQIEMSRVIAKAMAEAMWITIQTIAETQLRVEETQ